MPSKRKSRTHIFQRYRTRTSKRSCSQPKSKAEQDTEEVEALPPEEDEQIENSNSEGETETAKDNEEDSDQQVIQKKTIRENKKSDKPDNKVLEDNVQLSDDGCDVHTEGEKDTFDNLYKKASRRAHRYKSYSHEMLVAAYKCVKDLKMPVKAAARMFGVPSSTLHNRVQGQVQIDDSILTSEEVVKITEKLKNGEGLDDAFAGLTYEKSSGDLGRCFTSTVEDEDINDESLTESILQQMKYSAMTNDTHTVKEEVIDPEYEHQINQSDTENDNQNNGSTCSSSETFITPEQRDFRLRPDYEKLRRSYKRNYKTYSYEQLVAAYLYVKEKKVAVKFAARAFGVPPSTLNDRVQGKVFIDTSIVMNSPGGRKYLPKPDLVRAAISSKVCMSVVCI